MRTRGGLMLCLMALLTISASILAYLSRVEVVRLNDAYRALYEESQQMPSVILGKDASTGDIYVDVDGQHFYQFKRVCHAIQKT